MASQKRQDLLEVMCKYNDSSNEFNFTNGRDAITRILSDDERLRNKWLDLLGQFNRKGARE
jgi:septum formation topological specificity factor MinE